MAPRRGLIAVVSDFQSDPDRWRTALGAAALRHSVLCVQVVDPRDVELPPVGVLHFVDPATGATREVNTDDRKLRERYAEAAGRQQAAIAQAIRGAGADHMTLRTDGDWLMDLARHVSQRRHRAEVTAGRRTR
jgi:uncharacterized protein (DUF58 family)